MYHITSFMLLLRKVYHLRGNLIRYKYLWAMNQSGSIVFGDGLQSLICWLSDGRPAKYRLTFLSNIQYNIVRYVHQRHIHSKEFEHYLIEANKIHREIEEYHNRLSRLTEQFSKKLENLTQQT